MWGNLWCTVVYFLCITQPNRHVPRVVGPKCVTHPIETISPGPIGPHAYVVQPGPFRLLIILCWFFFFLRKIMFKLGHRQ